MRLLPAITAAALLAAPSHAQTEEWTAEDDLDCAIFVAAAMENAKDDADPELTMGLAAGMTYFIGRYEGQGGGDLEEAMIARYRAMSLEQFSSLGEKCGPRMVGMGERLQAAGNAFLTLGEDAEGDAEAAEQPSE